MIPRTTGDGVRKETKFLLYCDQERIYYLVVDLRFGFRVFGLQRMPKYKRVDKSERERPSARWTGHNGCKIQSGVVMQIINRTTHDLMPLKTLVND